MPRLIEDYALLGDTHSAALLSRDGSIDWLCWPRFDSDACFASLLGDERHGYYRIAPAAERFRASRAYRPGTMVLETRFETERGIVKLIDFMPMRAASPRIVRIVEGIAGEVLMRHDLCPRFGYGGRTPWILHGAEEVVAKAGPDALVLRSNAPVRVQDHCVTRDFVVKAGCRHWFELAHYPSHEAVAPPIDCFAALARCERAWREWCDRCTYEGPARELVIRSLLTLKALTYSPTGAVVAAPTTSLPEQLGGVRNWDYRYCWLRDATFTLLALMETGYVEEARNFRNWLLRAVAGEPAELQIMYGIAGERRLTEVVLPWLPGYERAAPVRIGNLAAGQFQLDVFGEVMDCLHHARTYGAEPSRDVWRLQCELVRYLEAVWCAPDDGIWETRGPRQHFVHSKVMAWVAVDRAIRSAARFGMPAPVALWRDLRARIHAEVCAQGFDPGRGTFTQAYGSSALDASLLMIPLVGFLRADDPRMLGTVRAIERELLHDGLVHRYDTRQMHDGLPPGEGVFLACSFWLADNYRLVGRTRDAERLFERLVSLANDVGLLSEQYDPTKRRLVGNFPQAFSHVALVNTGIYLGRPERERAERPLSDRARAQLMREPVFPPVMQRT